MGVVDLLVLGVLAVGLVFGLLRGFLVQVTGLLGLLGGVYAAYRFHGPVREGFVDRFLHTSHNGEIAFVGILIGVVLAVALVGLIVRKLVERMELGAYDRLLGGVFGLVKAGLICAGLLLGILMIAPRGGMLERSIGESRSAPVLWDAVRRAAATLPESMRGDVESFLQRHVPAAPPQPDEAPEPAPPAIAVSPALE